MALKITHTCEWCNKVEECGSIKLPKDWIASLVPDPSNQGTRDGGFCSTPCLELYSSYTEAALASAQQHYTNEFYSYMNKMRAAENEVS
jgi:hypothetical protein